MLGVRAGATDVGEGFQLGRAVDVTDYFMVGIFLLEFAKDRGWAAVGKGATGLQIGQQHLLSRAQHFGGFGHEVNAGEDDNVSVSFSSLLAQTKAITDIIRNVLNFRFLVIVGQDDGVTLFLELIYLGHEIERRIYIEFEVAHFIQIVSGKV